MRSVGVAVLIAVAVSCTNDGGDALSVEASPSVTADVESLSVSTTIQVEPTVPFVPTFQLEMAFLTCIEDLEDQLSDFDDRSAHCDERVFGG